MTITGYLILSVYHIQVTLNGFTMYELAKQFNLQYVISYNGVYNNFFASWDKQFWAYCTNKYNLIGITLINLKVK